LGGANRKSVRERIQDAMREIGTLLMTFGPLDAAIAYHDPTSLRFLLLFLALGLCLFSGALALERRR
jgi:hypothetical protein